MNTSKDVIINNKLNKFLTKNKNVKKYIYQYNKNDYNCCVCLDNSIEKDDKMIKYNHCGIIYIHEICLYDWFFENNGCILCKKMMIEKDEDTKSNSIFNNTISYNTISHNRYQNFFNINDNEGLNYDNENGNDIPNANNRSKHNFFKRFIENYLGFETIIVKNNPDILFFSVPSSINFI